MIIFHNPGLLDLEAVRLMGASVKKAGSFGRFGTGLKYAIATVLRGGGTLLICRGGEQIGFSTREVSVKGETFEEVVMVHGEVETQYEPLGFTTALGKDWEPWMAVRELACNARDEGGGYTRWEDPEWGPSGEGTEIALDWPEIEASWDETLKELFVPDDLSPLAEVEGVLIHPGESAFLYHRGVRVMKLPKKAAFTYNITAPVDLTEDRTAKYAFIVEENVRRALFECKDPEVIAEALSTKDGWEWSIKWEEDNWRKPSPGVLWLETVALLRGKGTSLPDTAKKLFLRHRAVNEAISSGGYYRDKTPAALSMALEYLESFGVELKEDSLYIADELPGDVMTMASGGRIYLAEATKRMRPHLLARELLTRHFELTAAGDHDTLLKMVVELLVETNKDAQRDRRLYREELEASQLASAA